jgi:hypothetical protein
MEKINQFFTKHGSKTILILLALVYFKSCSINSEVALIKKSLRANIESIDNNTEVIKTLPTIKDLKIEGLKSEKRMIQATDRKMLDVQRQNQIEKEIKELDSKK